MKRLFYFVALICFLFLTSCHNDDIPEVTDPGQAEKDSIEHACAYKEYCLLSAFCKAEKQPNGDLRYTPTYGDILYSTTPTIRYVAADNLKDAKVIFLSILSMAFDPAETVDITPNNITYRIEGKGSLRFLASSDEKTIARIEVDFPVILGLKEIVFIPKDRWPNNGLSLLNIGDVYEDASTEERNRFLCIRDTESSNAGILITFDGTIVERGKKKLKSWSSSVKWGKVKASADMYVIPYGTQLYSGMPTGPEFTILSKFLYYQGTSTRTTEADLIFVKGVGNRGGLSPLIFSKDSRLLTGGVSEADYYSYWFWYYYYGRAYFIKGNGDVPYAPFDYQSEESLLTKYECIPSLCVTVDSSFDPKENMLVKIYP